MERIANALAVLRESCVTIHSFVLFGGEPTLRWDLVQKAAEEIAQSGYEQGVSSTLLFTNGLLLNSHRLHELQSMKMQPVISFDGFGVRSRLRYGDKYVAMERLALGVIEESRVCDLSTVVAVTVGKHNSHSVMEDVARLWEEYGVNRFSLSSIKRRDMRAADTGPLRANLLQWAARRGVVVDWNSEGISSRYESYFVSSVHFRHCGIGEPGHWRRTGW